MPLSDMVEARFWIIFGLLTLAPDVKLSELSVRLAISGLASPVNSRQSHLGSNSGQFRPLVETQIISESELYPSTARIPSMISAYISFCQAGLPSLFLAWRCAIDTPYCRASSTSSIISCGEMGTCGVMERVGIIPVGVKLMI